MCSFYFLNKCFDVIILKQSIDIIIIIIFLKVFVFFFYSFFLLLQLTIDWIGSNCQF